MGQKETPENIEKAGVKTLVKNIGGFWYANLAGVGRKKGLPDLTVLIKGVVIQVEVKSPTGTQSPEQAEFQRIWEYCGGKYVCGTAGDFCEYLQKIGLIKTK